MRILYDPNEIVTSKYIREECRAIASLRILVIQVSGESKYIWAKVYGEGGKYTVSLQSSGEHGWEVRPN